MIYKFKEQDYEKVRPLYQGLDYHLTIRAVIEGTSPGRIYVDDVRSPKTAFMCSVEGYYLAGDAENADFNKALGQLICNISETRDTVKEGDDAVNLDVCVSADMGNKAFSPIYCPVSVNRTTAKISVHTITGKLERTDP
jgi:hypothetical protein